MGLRIGVDARLLGNEFTGIGQYVSELCKELDPLLPAAEFFFYAPWAIRMPVESPRWHARIDPWGRIFERLQHLWVTKHTWMLLRTRTLCLRDRINVFWATDAPFIPYCPRSVRIIGTVYDLRYLVAPETQRKTTLYIRRLLEKRLARANALVTISQGTTDKLRRFLGHEAVGIVRPAVSSWFQRKSEAEVGDVLDRYGIQSPYLLSIANADATPHKNTELLLRAFRDMRREGFLPTHTLVVGGPKSDLLVKNFQRRSGYDNLGIVALGYVPDMDLPALYSGADVFVFPSSYEGFGMPVLEARACQTKIVTTDAPELREAGGDRAIYISPTNEGIKNGIMSALAAPILNRPETLWTWNSSAKVLADVIDPGL
jgi:glycosyltransferase involved in cell wall biosynthesis